MSELQQLMTQAGQAIDAARGHVDTLASQHLPAIQAIRAQAAALALTAAGDSPEGALVDVLDAAVADLHDRAAAAFSTVTPEPPPAGDGSPAAEG